LARLTLFKDAKLDLEAKEAMTRRNVDINWFKRINHAARR
jgi:hypothetical protein